MITIEYSKHYISERKKFIKNNLAYVKQIAKALQQFISNPLHPSLNIEKLKNSKAWSIRIDKKNRIFFIWKNKTNAIFLDIGKHDKYRKY